MFSPEFPSGFLPHIPSENLTRYHTGIPKVISGGFFRELLGGNPRRVLFGISCGKSE